jgi:O-acetylserine/cysteine efflux transporter
VAPFSKLAPVFAIVSGAALLGQPVHVTDVVGGAVVMAGVALGLARRPRFTANPPVHAPNGPVHSDAVA